MGVSRRAGRAGAPRAIVRGAGMGIEKILIAEENDQGRDFLTRSLSTEGYAVEAHAEADQALASLMRDDFDLLMVSETLENGAAELLIERARDLAPDTPVVMLAELGRTPVGRRDVDGYLFRPYREERIALCLRGLRTTLRMQRENAYLRHEVGGLTLRDSLIGESTALRQVLELAKTKAGSSQPLMITGEFGSGKAALARFVHEHSDRASAPFIRVDCGQLPEPLLESELFGHERGAFSGAHRRSLGRVAVANGGTLVLDQIEELPVPLQAKLFRFLETGRYKRVGGERETTADVRVIAVNSRDLARDAEAGSFSPDLFERLDQSRLTLPALWERASDIPLLVSHFLNRARQGAKSSVRSVSPEAMDVLARYRWPGNVIELQNVMQRVVLLDAAEDLLPEHLPAEIAGAQTGRGNPFVALVGMSIHDIEREMILKTLEETGNNKTAAAKILGLTARTLHNKLKLYREQGIIAKDAYRPLRKRVEHVHPHPTMRQHQPT